MKTQKEMYSNLYNLFLPWGHICCYMEAKLFSFKETFSEKLIKVTVFKKIERKMKIKKIRNSNRICI